jgi:hypothetical protein
MAEKDYEVTVTVDFDMSREEGEDGEMGWEAVATGGCIGKMKLDRVKIATIFGSAALETMEGEYAAEYEGEG